MSMVRQSGRVLPRPVQVWVLDTIPGDVWTDGVDHPKDTIQFVRSLQTPLPSRKRARGSTNDRTNCNPKRNLHKIRHILRAVFFAFIL